MVGVGAVGVGATYIVTSMIQVQFQVEFGGGGDGVGGSAGGGAPWRWGMSGGRNTLFRCNC